MSSVSNQVNINKSSNCDLKKTIFTEYCGTPWFWLRYALWFTIWADGWLRWYGGAVKWLPCAEPLTRGINSGASADSIESFSNE